MVPTRSSSPRQAPHRMLVTLATAILVAASLAIAPVASAAPPGPSGPPTGSCDLQSKGDKIQHVIYLQFDNVHFERDNPNVPSDIEQMPHLYDFLKDNGTFDTNDHTILISHTGGGILSSLTGLYPDRHGQGVSNAYGYFNPAAQPAGVGFSSSFKYWTDNTDGGNPANSPADAVCRHELQHGQRRPGLARRHRRRTQRARAVGPVHPRRLRRRQRQRGEYRAREQLRDHHPQHATGTRPWRRRSAPARRTSRSHASADSPPARRSSSRPAPYGLSWRPSRRRHGPAR